MEIQAAGVQSTPKQFTNTQKAKIASAAVLSAAALASVPMAFYKGKSVAGEEKVLNTLLNGYKKFGSTIQSQALKIKDSVLNKTNKISNTIAETPVEKVEETIAEAPVEKAEEVIQEAGQKVEDVVTTVTQKLAKKTKVNLSQIQMI